MHSDINHLVTFDRIVPVDISHFLNRLHADVENFWPDSRLWAVDCQLLDKPVFFYEN